MPTKKKVTKKRKINALSSRNSKLKQLSRNMSKVEIKGQVLSHTALFVTSGIVTPITAPIIQGITEVDRIGTSIVGKGLTVKLKVIKDNTSAEPLTYRFIFFVKKNPNGVTPPTSELLVPLEPQGLKPLVSDPNYIILRDIFGSVNPVPVWNGSATFTIPKHCVHEFFVALKDLPISYLDNSGSATGAGQNQIYFLAIADSANGAFRMATKFTYIDL